MIKPNSVISTKASAYIHSPLRPIDVTVHIIGIVKSIKDGKVKIHEGVVSVNDEDYALIREKYPQYVGEELNDVQLVTPNEFDVIHDTVKDTSVFKNV